MARVPAAVGRFLGGRRFVVAGVSRHAGQPANAVFRKLRRSGYEVIPLNPNATAVEGQTCYPDLASIAGAIDGVVVVTHPDQAVEVVRQCAARGVQRVWFHRSFGRGSVSEEAVRSCEAAGLECIVGGCPLMYCTPVDVGHRCMAAWLRWRGRVPR